MNNPHKDQRAAMLIAQRVMRQHRHGYATDGYVDDSSNPMGDTFVPNAAQDYSQVPGYDLVTGAEDTLSKSAQDYIKNVKEAAQSGSGHMSDAVKSLKMEEGKLPINALWQYPLGAAETLMSPLTGAIESVGHGASELTGSKDIGERIGAVGGLLGPTELKMAGKAMPLIMGAAPKALEVARGVEAVAPQAARAVNDIGLYSHGAEMADQLPQAKGTPSQMVATLRDRYGVKPEELFNAGITDASGKELHPDWAGRKSVTSSELSDALKGAQPQIEETVLGGRGNPEMNHAAGQQWIDKNAAENAYNSGDISDISDWDIASPEVRDWHKEVAQNKFDELMATDPNFSERFQTNGQDGKTKFSKYTLPGGENYREVLLKAATDKPKPQSYSDWVASGSPGEWSSNGQSAPKTLFQSGHWEDPNVLAHLRMADRTGPNGEKILHVEEIQSDWGQKGREEGFVTKYNPEDIKPIDPANITSERRRNEFWNFETPTGAIDIPKNDRWPTMEAARQHILDNVNPTGIPTAPHVTSTQGWTDLALKRALKEAAEGGYDKMVWTPGEAQATRYDQVSDIDRVVYDPSKKELRYVKSGDSSWSDHPKTVEPKEIPSLLGKDAAEQLFSEPLEHGKHDLEAPGLKIGGEGMKSYYDKIVPTQLQKITKKLDPDAKIKMNDVPLPSRNGDNQPVMSHSIDITPKMRENILKGLPAFKRGGTVQSIPATKRANPDQDRRSAILLAKRLDTPAR